MAKWSNCNFCWKPHSKSTSEGLHFRFDSSAENISCHICWRYADNSIRRVFTSCQSLSQAYISTDVTADVSVYWLWVLKPAQICLDHTLNFLLSMFDHNFKSSRSSLIRPGVKDYMKMSKLWKNQIFELNFHLTYP